MRRLKAILAVFIFIVIVAPQRLFAQDKPSTKPNCFEQAAVRIRPNQSIKLFLRDKTKINGKFLEIDSVQSLLRMISVKRLDTTRFSYPMTEISKIQYKIGKGKSVIYGLISGTISGLFFGLVDSAVFPDHDGGDFALVTGSGAVGGVFSGLVFGYYGIIKCK